MTEVYSELYNVPSGVVFWRGRVANEGGRLAIVDGVAISESSDTSRKLVAKLTGGAGFQKEGDFTARAVAPGDDPATLPQPVSIELYDDGGSPQSSGVDPEFGELGKRKRKRKAGTAPEKGFGAVAGSSAPPVMSGVPRHRETAAARRSFPRHHATSPAHTPRAVDAIHNAMRDAAGAVEATALRGG